MPRQDVLDAFNALGLTPDVDIEEATKVYRRLALQHHPDRNHGDPSATERFQQISHSWDICQRYYENPDWANRPEGPCFPDDDDMDLEGEDLFQFYMFMFTETLYNRFNRSSRKQYKSQRSGHPAGPIFFSFGPSPEFYRRSYSDDSQDRQDKNAARQQKEKEEYERRKRELEMEVEREEREAKERAVKQKADVDRLVGAQERAFQAAHAGNADEVIRLINEYKLDVSAPRNLKATRGPRKQDESPQYETLLHAAACQCDESLFTFLIEKGANPSVFNKQSLNPFHVAIRLGNSKLVRFILERRGGKSFQDYHPSKATPSGSTPLQLAIESNDSATIELLVKHATTHDVERCWKQMEISEEVKETLRTKKGFVPPGEGLEAGQSRRVSKKAQRQQELAQEKEARIAEELRRAEVNRQKKEERATKRAEQEKSAGEAEQLRRKQEAEDEAERQQQEELRRTEAKARAKELEEVKLKTEAEEELRHAEAEERARKLKKEGLRVEAEEMRTRARKLEEERLKARAEEEVRRAEAEALARRLEEERLRAEEDVKAQKSKEEQEARERTEAEARDAWLRVQKERLELQRIEHERIRKAREERERKRLEQEMGEERRRVERQKVEVKKQEEGTSEETTAPPDTADEPGRAIPDRRRYGRSVLTDEQRRELRREKQKERKKAKHEQHKAEMTGALPQVSTSVPQPKASGKKSKPAVDVEQMNERQRNRYEHVMKRRAEQSARDKERHRKMMEERKAQVESPTQSEQSEYVPLTPVSTDAARPESVQAMILEPTLLSANSMAYMEDIQTCIIPDDLFREVRGSYGPDISAEGTGFVGKADNTEQPTRKPHRRFFRQYRHRQQ